MATKATSAYLNQPPKPCPRWLPGDRVGMTGTVKAVRWDTSRAEWVYSFRE